MDLRFPSRRGRPMGRVRVFVCASVSFGSQGSLSDMVALWAVSGFRFVLYSFGFKVSLATGSPFGTSSVWWRLRLLSPSGSFICVLLRLRWLRLRCGFAFFEFFGSAPSSARCDSCDSLPWSGGSLVSVSRPAVFLCVSSFMWPFCRFLWVSASFGFQVSLKP